MDDDASLTSRATAAKDAAIDKKDEKLTEIRCMANVLVSTCDFFTMHSAY
jgi:hypothetical protein